MNNTGTSWTTEMQTIQGPNGVRVEALIDGDGEEAVVFLHSSASGISQWTAYQQALSDRFTTAAVHLYGYGATSPWLGPGQQRLADQGRLVGSVLETLSRPTHIVGHSFGGAVALETARQYRDSVVSVAVFEPTLFWMLHPTTTGAWEEITAVVRAVQRCVASGDLSGAAAGFVNYWARDERWERMNNRQQAAVAAAMVAVAHEGEALLSPPHRPEDWLAGVAAPTLVLTAPDSPTPVREIARLVTTNGQRPLRLLDRGGHMTPITDPAAVLAVIQPFLDSHAIGSTTHAPAAVARI